MLWRTPLEGIEEQTDNFLAIGTQLIRSQDTQDSALPNANSEYFARTKDCLKVRVFLSDAKNSGSDPTKLFRRCLKVNQGRI